MDDFNSENIEIPVDCEKRALHCIELAAQCQVEAIAADFLMLAAQWRAMAVHEMYFRQEGLERLGERPSRTITVEL